MRTDEMVEPRLSEKAVAVALIVALLAISYALDYRQFMVIQQASFQAYELFLFVWAVAALLFVVNARFDLPYRLVSAAMLAHAFFWFTVQVYFGAASMTRASGSLAVLVVVNAILLLRREPWDRLLIYNAIVAAAVLPLALQQTIVLSAPIP
jgi:hypothetical protein